MPTDPIKTQDLILGYTLKERIGAGGYGEVWKAEAPGGIQKAVKLIYGFHDENRAQAELKSLNRIKEVRHPFLLSLERIEIVDGRLAVVTELADKSLTERFKECLEEGLDGIPRDELIRYLRDTADALDFISESHRLQHLDIKPENLLLVGNHIKVADFGLVKDIHDATQSLMAGLTPTYAPPELFDGRPSKSSDQYSLAIVYQEMLTGARPFTGTTAAQLASQHVHADPNLSKLPRGDQQPIRRALSKQPEARFSSCGVLVEELANRQAKKVRRESKRTVRSVKLPSDRTMRVTESSLLRSTAAPTVTKLGAVEIDPEQVAVRPTLFIGIGQTATNVLRRLRRRFRDRLGDAETIPALQILCIDTDVRDLAAATRSNGVDSLSIDETLSVPLRKPEDYRNDARMHLAWLSRRWIYNVPRSLQTEGIRPLGRLAFADHHDKIFDRLHDCIEQITLPESIARTSETIELDPGAESPQVFVVTSIAGGVGSGMVLDVAYAVRTVLLERGLQDDSVYGILAYSSGRSASERDLTVANTLSCLSEMNHYSRVTGYPGDESCDLPPFDDDSPTFAETYVVDLGSDLRQDEFEAATDNLAEYLYLNAATRCGAFFDACRASVDDDEQMMVRTFGLAQTATKDGDIATIPSYILAQRLLKHWMPTEKSTSESDTQTGKDLLQSCGISLSQIMMRFESAFARHAGLAPKSLIDSKVTELIHQAESIISEHGAEELAGQLESRVDEVLDLQVKPGEDQFGRHMDEEPSLAQIVHEEYEAQLGQFSESMVDVVLGALDPLGQRLDRSRRVYEQVSAHLQDAIAEARGLRQRNNADLTQAFQQLNAVNPGSSESDEDRVDVCALIREYGQLRTRGFVLHCALRVISDLQHFVERVLDSINQVLQFSFDMLQLLDKRVQDEQRTALVDQKDIRLIERLLTKRVTMHVDELCHKADAILQDGFLAEMGGFRKLVCGETRWEAKLEAAILRASRSIVTDVYRRLDLDQMFAEENIDASQIAQWWQHRLEKSTPRLLPQCGGASRLLIAVPNGSSTKALSQCVVEQFQEKPTLLEATNGDVDVCYEVDQMPLPVIAENLIASSPDCVEYVARLHTRTDIQWTPIVRLT